jgi:hypothetical protein
VKKKKKEETVFNKVDVLKNFFVMCLRPQDQCCRCVHLCTPHTQHEMVLLFCLSFSEW